MRDLESRERKALDEMLRKAELSFAVVWCYPGCRIPVRANADLQSAGGVAPGTWRIKRDPKRGTTRGGFWKHMEVEENVKHSYEHGFAPTESKGEEEEGHPRQPVPWVVYAHAACASVQS